MNGLVNLMMLLGSMASPCVSMAEVEHTRCVPANRSAPMFAQGPANSAWPDVWAEAWPDMSGHAGTEKSYGLEFDGDDYAATADTWTGNADGTCLSAAFWVKATAGWVMGQYVTRSWAIGSDPPTVIAYHNSIYSDSTTKMYSFGTNWMDGRWHHVAFTWHTGELLLYLDGALDTGSKGFDGDFTTINPVSQPFTLGGLKPATPSFIGELSSVHVYPSTLSQAQIKSLMRGSVPVGASVSFPMLCADGVTNSEIVHDSSGNRIHAQRGAVPGEDSANPEWVGPYTRITSGGPE
jgi:concanavalin A-like lectin/glucanase superfamily protein